MTSRTAHGQQEHSKSRPLTFTRASPPPALQTDISSLYNLKFHAPALGPEPAARTPEGSPVHCSGPSKDSFGELSRATIRLLEELDQER